MALPTSPDGKILYCITYEKFIKGKWVPQFAYTHAEDAGEARMHFVASIEQTKAYFHIGAIAPVIGYKIEDKQGMILSV